MRRSGKQACAAAALILAAGLAVRAADPPAAFIGPPSPPAGTQAPPSPEPASAPDGTPAPSVAAQVPGQPPERPAAQAAPGRLDPAEIKALVDRFALQYGIPDHAPAIARVIHLESRGYTAVRSKSGRFVGMCQFMPHTFNVNVEAMKRAGFLPPDRTFSPLNPEDAVHVMVWMWSQGLHRQWGPARRMKIEPVRPIDLTLKSPVQ